MMEPQMPAIVFYDLCRLCLENAGLNDMFTQTDLVHDIFLCTGVDVGSEDNLPRKICYQCSEIVIKAKRLRVLAAANDAHLKSLFDDNETFTIGFNKTDQSQKEGNTISRKSSTDSDRTVKLEIIENFDSYPEEEILSQKRRTSNSSDQSQCEEQVKKKISVRNDLSDSLVVVSQCEEQIKKKISVRNDLSDSLIAVSQCEEQIKKKISVINDLSDSLVAVSKSEKDKKILVRKDLFNSSSAVTSSTKNVNTSSIKKNLKVKIKRFKTETGDCFHYVCDVCQKKFNTWKKYYLHQKTHNRHIMCPLDTCGKKFATKGDLEKHVRTHTGERPFNCDLCDRRFSQRCTLKSHKFTVHAEAGTPEKS